MKKIALIFLFLFSVASSAQNISQKQKHTSTPTPKKGLKGTSSPAQTQNLVTPLLHDTCLNKEFSIVFYILLDTVMPGNPGYPGVGVVTSPTVSLVMNNINSVFKPICVSFANCSTVYMPNYQGARWKKSITEPIVTANWYAENTINIYLVQNDSLDLGYGNTEKEGYTYPPTPGNLSNSLKNIIVLEKGQFLQGNGAILIHLLGHFFGLTHTHEEATSVSVPPAVSLELADGSNCATNGDGFCDTEADPGNQSTTKDANGDLYIHPIDNFMSYYSQRCRFTQQQYNRMAYIIATKRMYLH